MTTITKTSEWIEQGGLESGFQLIERPIRETAKAIAFQAQKWNRAGNLKPAELWLPKSQLQEVENDYYEHGAEKMHLAPDWLVFKKRDEGFEI